MTAKKKTYVPMAGEMIDHSAKKMVALANESGQIVTANFNDIQISAKPGADPKAIVKDYYQESRRRHDAYITRRSTRSSSARP